MTRLLAAFIILGALLLPCAQAGEPQGVLATIKKTGVIRLGYLASSPPFSFDSGGNIPAGFSVDLCRRAAEGIRSQLGLASLRTEWVKLDLSNRLAAVRDGKVDIECATSTITLSRLEKVDFTHMTFISGGALLVKRGSGIHSVAGLVDETVAVVPGTTTEKALRAALEKSFVNAKLVPVKDHAEGLAAVESGKASAYASDRVILVGLLLDSGKLDQFGLAEEPFSYEPYGFMVRRNDADFRLVANRTLARLYRTGEVLKIFERWFGKLGDPPPALAAMYLMNSIPE